MSDQEVKPYDGPLIKKLQKMINDNAGLLKMAGPMKGLLLEIFSFVGGLVRSHEALVLRVNQLDKNDHIVPPGEEKK